MKRKITTPAVPEPPGNLFSNCVVVGDQVFLSGMTAAGVQGMEAQAKTCFEKIRACVEAAGGTLEDVVKLTIYVTDMSGRPQINKARAEFFPGEVKPCSTFLKVAGFVAPELLIEIDAFAVLGAGRK